MQNHNNLVLEIQKQGRVLSMSLFEQAPLSPTVKHYVEVKFDSGEVERLIQEMHSILNKARMRADNSSDLTAGLIKTGQLLWGHLLAKSVKERLKDASTSHLTLFIDEELIHVPWELLHNGKDFLCLEFALSRLVRTKKQEAIIQYRNVPNVPKMLILANPTNDLRASYLEGINIRNQFDRKRNAVRINFKSTLIDKIYVKKYFSDYDIVHFAGHCEYDEAEPKNSGWVLNDGRFTVQDILNMGSFGSLPTLVFSNACYSAKEADSAIDKGYQRKSYSLAAAFLFSGIRHYLGAIGRIQDNVSLSFARHFYAGLISGRSVGESARAGRLSLIKEYGLNSLFWTNYLLYGDPNFILFGVKQKETEKGAKRKIFTRRKLAFFGLFNFFFLLVLGLYTWLPSLNPNSYFLFLEANRNFRQGNNQAVIVKAKRIIDKEPFFLSAYPLLADTYQRQGQKESALKVYYDYACASEKRKDFKNLAAAYINIGWNYHLGGDYKKANDFYEQALTLAKKYGDKLNEAAALRKTAVLFMDKNDYDSALRLLIKSSEINRERVRIKEHRYNLACDYFDLGLVFSNKDDFASAENFYNKSRVVFEKLKLTNELSDYYFNLGEICMFGKQYQAALDHYNSGLRIDKQQGNLLNLCSDYNLIGELYLEMDRWKEAEEAFLEAASISKKINLLPELASSYYNLGLVFKKKGHKNKTREYWRQAQEIYSVIDEASYKEIKRELLDLS